MRRRPLPMKRFREILDELGFVTRSESQHHDVYLHEQTGLIVTLPKEESKLSEIHLISAIKQIERFGIASIDDVIEKIKYVPPAGMRM